MKLFHRTAIALFISTISTTTVVFADEMALNAFESFDVKTASVSFADLKLTSPADAKILLDRIEKTARKVCQRLNSGTGLEELMAARQCFTDSYRNGIVAINSKKSFDIEAIAAGTTAGLNVVAAD